MSLAACTQDEHRAMKMLYVIAPDLSPLRFDGENGMGRWVTCRRCLSTMLIERPRVEALRVTL